MATASASFDLGKTPRVGSATWAESVHGPPTRHRAAEEGKTEGSEVRSTARLACGRPHSPGEQDRRRRASRARSLHPAKSAARAGAHVQLSWHSGCAGSNPEPLSTLSSNGQTPTAFQGGKGFQMGTERTLESFWPRKKTQSSELGNRGPIPHAPHLWGDSAVRIQCAPAHQSTRCLVDPEEQQ